MSSRGTYCSIAEDIHLAESETVEDVVTSLTRLIEQLYNAKRVHSARGHLLANELEETIAW